MNHELQETKDERWYNDPHAPELRLVDYGSASMHLRSATVIILICLTLLSGSPFSVASTVNPVPCVYVINTTIYFNFSGSSGSGLPDMPDEITIPLKRAGRLLLMEARIDNETGNFIFDTGSSKLVLNSTYFRKYVSMETGDRGGITGAVASVRQTKVSRIQVSGLAYNNVLADLADLGHIENRRGAKILGLLGFSLVKNMEIVIDIGHNELHLYRLDKSGNRISGSARDFKTDISQKVQMYQDVLFVTSKISGKILSFCLDTGAESNVISSGSPKKVMSTVSIIRRSGLVGSGKPLAEALYGIMNDFVIGGYQIPHMQTIIANLDIMSAAFGFPIDGMLGYDFFEKGQICINLVRMEMKICLNKSQKE